MAREPEAPDAVSELRGIVVAYPESHHDEDVGVTTMGDARAITNYIDELTATIARLEGEKGVRECVWSDEDANDPNGTFDTMCGSTISFAVQSFAEIEAVYCQKCGGKIVFLSADVSEKEWEDATGILEAHHALPQPTPLASTARQVEGSE